MSEAASELKDKLLAVEDDLVSRPDVPWVEKRNRGTLFPKRLNGRLADLIDTVAISYAAPPRQCREVYSLLSREIDARLARLNEIMDGDLEGFTSILDELEVPSIIVRMRHLVVVPVQTGTHPRPRRLGFPPSRE